MSESMFPSRRRSIFEERSQDVVFNEMVNRLDQEILQTNEFQEAIREAIKKKGRALQPEDILDDPVLQERFMDYLLTMAPIMIFDIIVLFHQSLLYALAMRILGNHHSAEDVVQESLMRAYVALKSYSKEQLRTLKIRPWLCRIVQNTANNYRARESRLVHLDLSEGSEFLEIEGSRFEQPEVAMIINEADQEFRKILRRLPEKYRVVALLKYLEEFDYKEISLAMNIANLNTLKTLKRRSVQHMKKLADDMNIQEKDLEIWAQAQGEHYSVESE